MITEGIYEEKTQKVTSTHLSGGRQTRCTSQRIDDAKTSAGNSSSRNSKNGSNFTRRLAHFDIEEEISVIQSTETWYEMAQRFILLVIPAIIMQISSYFVFLVNMVFAGRMTEDTAAKVAAVGLGNLFLALCCRYVLAGMNSAVETFVSQAYG